MFTSYTKLFSVLIIAVFFYVTTIAQTKSYDKEQNRLDQRLTGLWKATLKESDGVKIDFWMTIEITKKENSYAWEAFSRPGAAREIIGGTAFLGSLLGKLPPREALVFIGDGVIIGDRSNEKREEALQLKGALKSPFLGNRDFTGRLSEDMILRAELKRPNGETAGTMEFIRDKSPAAAPLRDYKKLGRETEDAIRNFIYDPSLLQREDYMRFLDAFKRRLAAAQDDLDAITAFQAGKRLLQTSHFDFIRNPDLASKSIEELITDNGAKNPANLVSLTFPAPQVAFLRVSKWDRVSPAVDKAFEQISAVQPSVLILDIRNNPGGDATSMAPLEHLIQKPTPIGAFLGRKWYEKHPVPSTVAEMSGLDLITGDRPPAELFMKIRENGAVRAQTTTKSPYFDGLVYLLIDKGTASASEPLAYILKTSRRATLVGERTAGAMLTALPHPVGDDGWLVTVPEADFVAADGVRLEGKGVSPDIATASNDVFIAVADQIEKNLPFSAAMLKGASYESLKRPEDAEKAYRKSLSLVDSQNPRPQAKSLAAVRKRLAAILKARGNAQGAKREYEEILRLIPDDAEALAALRTTNN